MIYEPNKHPKRVFSLITGIVLIGIFGSSIHKWFTAGALIFWIHYTVVLSYLQFKRKSKHDYSNITEILLNPQIRFFIFEAAATTGLIGVLKFNWISLGIVNLLIWWMFSLNFYYYYKGKYEN